MDWIPVLLMENPSVKQVKKINSRIRKFQSVVRLKQCGAKSFYAHGQRSSFK